MRRDTLNKRSCGTGHCGRVLLVVFVLAWAFLPAGTALAAESASSGRIDAAVGDAVTVLADRAAESRVRGGDGPSGRMGHHTVAVGTITYSDTGIGSELSSFLGQKLRSALRNSPRFEVSDSDNLDKVMEQMKLALSGLADEAQAPEVGKLKTASALLEGSYRDSGTRVTVTLELTDVETGLNIAGSSFSIGKGEVPETVALLPDNYGDAMEVISELSEIMDSPDEGLETRVWTERGNGATYRDGENLVIRFFANRACYIKVYHIDVNRETSLIFPNEFYRDNSIKAGKIYTIPDEHYPFRFELGAPFGTEFIKVVASTRQFSEIEEAFSSMGRADEGLVTRGLTVKQKDELRAEEMISYTILE